MGAPIILSGPNAFYAAKNYENDTKKELAQPTPLKNPHYRFETESKVVRVAKIIFAILFFPVGIYWGLHYLAGKQIVQSTSRDTSGNSAVREDSLEALKKLQGDWKIKRLSIEVNGILIDAILIGKKSTLNNGRWVLHSNGNAELYEDSLPRQGGFSDSQDMLNSLKANGLYFNYPGVGSCQGRPTRSALKNAYKGMLSLLEDKQKGIGAKEIICHGHSLGGAVQGEAIADRALKKGVKYVFIKDRTFSELKIVIRTLISKILAFISQLIGWNMGSVDSSKKLKAPEIIIQTCKKSNGTGYVPLLSPQDIATVLI